MSGKHIAQSDEPNELTRTEDGVEHLPDGEAVDSTPAEKAAEAREAQIEDQAQTLTTDGYI